MRRILSSILVVGLLLASVSADQSTCQGGQLFLGSACVQCPYVEGCSAYANDGSCSACEFGYAYQNGACSVTNISQSCSECCASYAADGSCASCNTGLILENNQCVRYKIFGCIQKNGKQCAVCASGLSLNNGNCVVNVQGCNGFNSNGVCNSCQDGYFLKDNLCHLRANVPNCQSYSRFGCVQCQNNYFLTSNGTCSAFGHGCIQYWQGNCIVCDPHYNLANGICSINGCAQYGSNGCAVCSSPYSVSNGKCMTDTCLKLVDGNCVQCKSEFRITANGTCVKPIDYKCTSCPFGYVFTNNACVMTINGCTQYNGSICVSCASPFMLTVNGKCQIFGCSNYSSTGCANCVSPFVLSNQGCSIVGCDTLSANGCLKCSTNYFFVNNNCFPYDPNCVGYHSGSDSNDHCTGCVANYHFNQNGVCVQNQRGCSYDANGNCSSCLSNFVFDKNRNCVILGCSSYDNSNNCLACSQPFTFNSGICSIPFCNELCSSGCKTCQNGYVLNNGLCYLGDIYCLTYQNGKCSTCKTGFSLNANGKCIKNISNCLTVANDQVNCAACQSGYQVYNGQCVQTISNCLTQDYTSGLCNQCTQGYHLNQGLCVLNNQNCVKYTKTDNLNQVCSQCASGYYLNNKQCITSTPGCVYSQSTGQCVSCNTPFVFDSDKNTCYIPGCSQLSTDGTCCQLCYSNFRLNNKICTIDYCASYSYQSCLSCVPGYNLSNGICVSTDPNCVLWNAGACTKCCAGYNVVGGRCVVSDVNCKAYGNDGSCISCASGYYLSKTKKCQLKDFGCIYQGGVCAFCQDPFTMNTITQKCQITNCLETNANGCLNCRNPFQLASDKTCQIPNCQQVSEGACVLCSTGYHLNSGVSCAINDVNCLSYDSDGDCQLCATGYLLMSSGQCELAERTCVQTCASDPFKCLACKSGYFLNRFYQCQIKDTNCTEYTNGACSKCGTYFFLYQSMCIPFLKGCVKYSGKDCIQCRVNYALAGGVCLAWNTPGLKLLGTDDQYDFLIVPIDVRQSKYYIDNLSPASAIGNCFWSSVYGPDYQNATLTSDGPSLSKGWKSLNADQSEFIGFNISGSPVTFFAVQLEAVEGNYITQFYIQYSNNGIDFITVQTPYNVTSDILTNLTTIYFTGIYAQAIRIKITSFYGWPACRIEFFYYDYLRFSKISNLKSLKYLEESIESNFVDHVDNQVYINQVYFFNPQAACKVQQLCFTGLELCKSTDMKSVSLTFGNLPDQVTEFYITYSLDGIAYNCYQSCMKFYVDLGVKKFQLPLSGLRAKDVRIYPTKYNGSPTFNTAYDYQ